MDVHFLMFYCFAAFMTLMLGFSVVSARVRLAFNSLNPDKLLTGAL